MENQEQQEQIVAQNKDLKVEVYDLSKEINQLKQFIGGVANAMGLEGSDVTFENIEKGMIALTTPIPKED